MQPKAVISLDIDATQYLYAKAETDPAAYVLKRLLEDLQRNGEIFLTHNTGRPFPWVCHGEQVPRFLNPIIADDARIISNAGTVIWNEDRATKDLSWEAKILEIVSPETVKEVINRLQEQGVQLHPETFGNDFKISVQTTAEEHHATVEQLKHFLAEEFPGKFDVAFWNNTSADITPLGINKRTALEHLIKQQQLEGVPVFVAGDSMNDFPLLSAPDFYKTLVGNAIPELVGATRGMPNLHHASSSHEAAAGVLSGLVHFGLVDSDLVKSYGYDLNAKKSSTAASIVREPIAPHL